MEKDTSKATVQNKNFEINSVNSLDSCQAEYRKLYDEFATVRNNMQNTQLFLDAENSGEGELMYTKIASSGIKLFVKETSLYEGPKLENGEIFLGLYRSSNKEEESYLAKDTPIKRIIEEDIAGFSVEEKYGAPVFLFKGISPTNPGKILGKDLQNKFIMPGENIKINLKENQYIVYATGAFTVDDKGEGKRVFNSISDYKLKIRTFNNDKISGDHTLWKKEAIIYYDTIWWSEDVEPILIWAGDIDGDDQLDLVTSKASKVCYSYTLYLSSKAEKGNIFGPAATMLNCGC